MGNHSDMVLKEEKQQKHEAAQFGEPAKKELPAKKFQDWSNVILTSQKLVEDQKKR